MSASLIIEKFGSSYRLAKEISKQAGREIHRQTVVRWQYPRKLGGTNGYIPYKFHQFVWDAARECGVELKPEDFLNIKYEDKNQ